jgi:succinyl-diaminopimelate desuccinylase
MRGDKMADKIDFEQISRKIDSYKKEMIDLQGKLTAIPAISPLSGGEGEWKKAQFIKSYLGKIGFDEIKEYNSPDDSVPDKFRPNIAAIIKGESSDFTAWVMAHMDIVPPGELSLWKTDPYKIEVKDGKIYGRGVEDNQQGLVSSIFAAKVYRDLGIKPKHNIGLMIVADEEMGSKHGIQFILKQPNVFKKEDLIIVPDGGNSEGTMIEVAEKSILWLKFTTIGEQCHASTPQKGINAHKAAANLIVKLNSLYQLYPVKDNLFEPPFSTFEPTKKEANVPNVNTIPGEDVFYLDSRIMPEYEIKDVQKKIRGMCDEIEKEFGVKISIESPQSEQAAPNTPADSHVVKALEKAVKVIYDKKAKPMGIGGGTVAAYFRRLGYNAAVWSRLDELAHQPNEYCIIDNLIGDAKVFAYIFLNE